MLSPEWLERRLELDQSVPPAPGADAEVQWRVTKGRKDEVAFVDEIVDGRIVASRLGEATAPDMTLIASWADAVAMLDGTLDPDVAFMRGRLKFRGDMGLYLALMPRGQTDEARAARAALEAETDLGSGRG